jgi:hypothetical protein
MAFPAGAGSGHESGALARIRPPPPAYSESRGHRAATPHPESVSNSREVRMSTPPSLADRLAPGTCRSRALRPLATPTRAAAARLVHPGARRGAAGSRMGDGPRGGGACASTRIEATRHPPVRGPRASPGPAGVGKRPGWAAPRRLVDEWTALVLPTLLLPPGDKDEQRRSTSEVSLARLAAYFLERRPHHGVARGVEQRSHRKIAHAIAYRPTA